MRYLRAARELTAIVGMLCFVVATSPFWVGWIVWRYYQIRKSA
jgi:hypothetical protein